MNEPRAVNSITHKGMEVPILIIHLHSGFFWLYYLLLKQILTDYIDLISLQFGLFSVENKGLLNRYTTIHHHCSKGCKTSKGQSLKSENLRSEDEAVKSPVYSKNKILVEGPLLLL